MEWGDDITASLKKGNQATLPRHQQRILPDKLGKYITQYAALVGKLVWERFVKERRGRGDLMDLEGMYQLSYFLLQKYRHRVSPVVLAGREWTKEEHQRALEFGPHQSMMYHVPFIIEKFDLMVGKGKWVVLPYSVAKHLMGPRLIPPRVKEERDWRPRWICDYSYSNINVDSLLILPPYSMKYGRALDRLIREVVIADPTLGPI